MITKEEAFKEILHYVKSNGIVNNSSLIHYFKDRFCYFQYDSASKHFYVNKQKVWFVLEKTYQMKTFEIMNFIEKQVKEHWKLTDIRILVKGDMPQYNQVVFKDVKDLKTWEDICLHLGKDPHDLPDVSKYNDKHKKHAIANFKLTIIAEVRNNGWIPDYSNSTQQKWYPYFQWKKGTSSSKMNPMSSLRSGFVFCASSTGGGCTYSGVGGRLCFPTEQESDSFGKDFIELYNDLLGYT